METILTSHLVPLLENLYSVISVLKRLTFQVNREKLILIMSLTLKLDITKLPLKYNLSAILFLLEKEEKLHQ